MAGPSTPTTKAADIGASDIIPPAYFLLLDSTAVILGARKKKAAYAELAVKLRRRSPKTSGSTTSPGTPGETGLLCPTRSEPSVRIPTDRWRQMICLPGPRKQWATVACLSASFCSSYSEAS